MTSRKHQNSILVLATLGVYLGLVLVGATPQVWAQAAMTQQFDVKDEIEVKDDLDKKPKKVDDETVIFDSSGAFFVDECTKFVSGAALRFRGLPLDLHGKMDAPGSDPELTRWFSIHDALVVGDLKYETSDLGFQLQISLTKSSPQADVHAYFDEIRNVFQARNRTSGERNTSRLTTATTSVSLAGDQIFVTTRLPRAGLNSLLATDAK